MLQAIFVHVRGATNAGGVWYNALEPAVYKGAVEG